MKHLVLLIALLLLPACATQQKACTRKPITGNMDFYDSEASRPSQP